MVPRSSADTTLTCPRLHLRRITPDDDLKALAISLAHRPPADWVPVGPFQANTPSPKAWYPRARDATVPVKGASLTIHPAVVFLLSES